MQCIPRIRVLIVAQERLLTRQWQIDRWGGEKTLFSKQTTETTYNYCITISKVSNRHRRQQSTYKNKRQAPLFAFPRWEIQVVLRSSQGNSSDMSIQSSSRHCWFSLKRIFQDPHNGKQTRFPRRLSSFNCVTWKTLPGYIERHILCPHYICDK